MMAKQTKTVTMQVTVRCPKWLTAQQARREVRTLINEQCFYGQPSIDGWSDVNESNFRAASVRPMKGN